ncbi:glycoside hydrolase/deacetylase [Rhizopus microsporus var. microsporus]|uniref:Glycoside hydrolase/deacetylase n=2 Tax=Rhizopus microsporus TaxID=58291 RepID=A0A2G4T924_RHIZD|nr:glycoside hydrolase/deacetylase [Rhizopus microsporus ATCC 52813]ORE09236.1 glycoside hydrolase/deacetylase [Rhizopus microsporus var. microsporus]PHZ17186.1 glycoside hydrolase/deacetylase [Rhizopus microsporus ATCC 52813]
MKLAILSAALLTAVTAAPSPTKTTGAYIPQKSPSFSNVPSPTGIVTAYNYGPYNTSDALPTTTLSGYPSPWEVPDTKSDEVQAAIKQIDWSLVPDAPVRKQDDNGDFKPDTDGDDDPYCWWSDTNCVKPKINLPEDYYICPNKGDWGLSYDDGPFNLYTGKEAAIQNKYAEPALYNYLVEHNNQKASLFYIGSNVATYPEAAKRAFNDGHYICVHTWSHPAMTTMTNEEAVAEFYWTLKAIKETTGVTPKCWRPPQGDVDDRIRSIAWQMGMHTVLWDWDTNDWDMPAPGGGNLAPSKVDGYFKGWIEDEQSGNQTHGHIVLEHELNNATVNMTMFWLPKIQKVFNVVPALACNNVTQPYWEQQYVYPLQTLPIGGSNSSSSATETTIVLSSALPRAT